MGVYTLRVDARGRVVLPAALRAESGLAEGQTVVAVVKSDGQVVLLEAERLMDDLREACKQMGPQSGTDELDRWRAESDAKHVDRFAGPAM